MSEIKTTDLDVARARALWSLMREDEDRCDMELEDIDQEPIVRLARAIREADEAAGLPTSALLAVLRHEAVILPPVPPPETRCRRCFGTGDEGYGPRSCTSCHGTGKKGD